MPLVRIDLKRGKSADYRKTLGEIVYKAMIDLINVPRDDKFQVITEHDRDGRAAQEMTALWNWTLAQLAGVKGAGARQAAA